MSERHSYVCPHCGDENNIRASTVGTVQRCRNCSRRVRVDDRCLIPTIPAAPPDFRHGWHILLTVLTLGYWSPVWFLAWTWHTLKRRAVI